MTDAPLVRAVQETLRAEGFPLVGTARAVVDGRNAEGLTRWLAAGLEGPLAYMRAQQDARSNPSRFEAWVRGAFCVALPYNTRRELSAHPISMGRAWVSRYAWGRDYHNVLRARMGPAARLLRSEGFRARICVDTVPILERSLAARAGLGFIGKNGLLIHPELGSYLFLGEILTDMELPEGPPVGDGCGECTLCLKGCPTQAFVAPRVLDAGRCLSTWTIEHRGPFPPSTPSLRGHLFGCDRCQEVCPYNREAPLAEEPEFEPREPWFAPDPRRIEVMAEEDWDEATRGTAVRRARHDGLVRNARRISDEKAEVGSRKSEVENRKMNGGNQG
jgi:epoxyqueuosine reductase